jgi:hypothetical protein
MGVKVIVHNHTSRLANIELALVGAYGLLRCMESDGSIPLAWKSQTAEKKKLLGIAILEVMALRNEEEKEKL